MKARIMSMVFLLACPAVFISSSCAADGDKDLIGTMAKMQYFLHKTGLSLQAENKPLARFYLHELEETIEDLESFGKYKDLRIGPLTKSMLLPSFSRLEQTLKKTTPKQAWPHFESLVDSCNRCHETTRHGFIKVEFNNLNTYMQSFAPAM